MDSNRKAQLVRMFESMLDKLEISMASPIVIMKVSQTTGDGLHFEGLIEESIVVEAIEDLTDADLPHYIVEDACQETTLSVDDYRNQTKKVVLLRKDPFVE